uniref:Uncharacterized protein n=1 Tax=Nelumbo nucifera TaxID=4432 RepID=A0A822YWP6_NELNU|nr:TPA_asm: hypothetical protein HUJ06_006205 [Nelumbo nucifera]
MKASLCVPPISLQSPLLHGS